jgi:hypothetical protein
MRKLITTKIQFQSRCSGCGEFRTEGGDLREEAGATQEPIVVTDVDAHFQSVVRKRTMTLQFGQCGKEDCPPSRGQDSAMNDRDGRKEEIGEVWPCGSGATVHIFPDSLA